MKEPAPFTPKAPDLVANTPHALEVQEAIACFRTSSENGLSTEEAAARLAAYGPNQLSARARIGLWRLLRNQFENPVVFLLAAAALVAFAFGEWKEGLAVVVVLWINGVMGFVTELRAVRSMEALRRLGNLTTKVRRGGRAVLLPA